MAGDAELAGLAPMHSGELLREDVLPSLGVSKTAAARHLGISRTTLYALLNEETPVTARLALRLGKLCGNGPRLWLNLQQDYDLRTLEPQMASDLARNPTLSEYMAVHRSPAARCGKCGRQTRASDPSASIDLYRPACRIDAPVGGGR